MEPPKSARKKAEAWICGSQRRTVAVFTENNWHARSWDAQNWVRLTEKLLSGSDTTVVLCGNNVQNEANAQMAKIFAGRERFTDLTGKTDIAELGAVLALADVFITTDCGPMHVAFACGCKKVVGLFGPTEPDTYFTPYAPHVALTDKDFPIRWNGNNEPITEKNVSIPVETVLQACEAEKENL